MQTKLLSWAGSGGTRNALTKGMIDILGPEEAIPLFGRLDLSKTGERLGIEGAVMALTMFGGERFPDMDPARRDKLRDLYREYGIGLLSQESREEAERDSRGQERGHWWSLDGCPGTAGTTASGGS